MSIKSDLQVLKNKFKPKEELKVIFDEKEATGPEHVIYVLLKL